MGGQVGRGLVRWMTWSLEAPQEARVGRSLEAPQVPRGGEGGGGGEGSVFRV